MIKPNHSLIHELFFRNYFRHIIKKSFHSFEIVGEYKNRDKPLLLISNHFSWWDGFIAYELNRQIFRKKFHLIMLEEQLKKYSYFTRLGAFSINPGSRSAVESINLAKEILANSNNLIVLFPQGKIESQHHHTIKFMKGWYRLMEAGAGNLNSVFTATFTDYFSQKKPTLRTYFKEHNLNGNSDLKTIELSYQSFYNNCLQSQTEQR